jgi:putative lipoic acid-binding regulatory protein
MTADVPAPDTYPAWVPIKAMGLATAEFETLVIGIVRHHMGDLTENAVSTRPSANGKYVSVTVNVYAQSRAQLEAAYRALRADARVLMTL